MIRFKKRITEDITLYRYRPKHKAWATLHISKFVLGGLTVFKSEDGTSYYRIMGNFYCKTKSDYEKIFKCTE